jgi:iron only hydrogenase large subunit-like protein
MTLNQLRNRRSALTAKITEARNTTFAEGTSEGIKQAIIDANVKRLQRQINGVDRDIAKVEGKTNRKQFANSVLPLDFQIS